MVDSKEFELTVKHPTGILLWKVSNQWVKAQNQALGPFGITHAQCVLLYLVNRFEGLGEEGNQVQLAALSEMDVMVVSQALRTLEGKKLIERHISARDSRAKAARLTAAGKTVLAGALNVVIETNNRFYARLGEREIQLRECLKDLLDASNGPGPQELLGTCLKDAADADPEFRLAEGLLQD